MEKLWTGRFQKDVAPETNDFNSSIAVDGRMYREDIAGSIAHAEMLAAQGIIPAEDGAKIVEGLRSVLSDIESGALAIDSAAEDIHTFVEKELTARVGDAGKKLHTARSRNDQVALDTRMYLIKKSNEISTELLSLLETLVALAEKYSRAIMPGYTHLQRAQPVTFAHYMLAYAAMFMRDHDRLKDCIKRTRVSPLGCGALAGTTYPIDRAATANALGFPAVSFNSLDGVSDRDFVIELSAVTAIIMTHLSRFAEEIILWCSSEFKFLDLDDAYSTGSSIMPQKKNPDVAELVRGKTGRVYGDLVTILTVMKGLPLSYNKDMQEDKECVFDAVDTVLACLPIFSKMLCTSEVLTANMAAAAEEGFINATDCADYLTKKGVPFRDAYKITGGLVALCIRKKQTLSTLPISDYKAASPVFAEDVYQAVDMANCLGKRTSFGAPGEESVKKQTVIVKRYINENS